MTPARWSLNQERKDITAETRSSQSSECILTKKLFTLRSPRLRGEISESFFITFMRESRVRCQELIDGAVNFRRLLCEGEMAGIFKFQVLRARNGLMNLQFILGR